MNKKRLIPFIGLASLSTLTMSLNTFISCGSNKYSEEHTINGEAGTIEVANNVKGENLIYKVWVNDGYWLDWSSSWLKINGKTPSTNAFDIKNNILIIYSDAIKGKVEVSFGTKECTIVEMDEFLQTGSGFKSLQSKKPINILTNTVYQFNIDLSNYPLTPQEKAGYWMFAVNDTNAMIESEYLPINLDSVFILLDDDFLDYMDTTQDKLQKGQYCYYKENESYSLMSACGDFNKNSIIKIQAKFAITKPQQDQYPLLSVAPVQPTDCE